MDSGGTLNCIPGLATLSGGTISFLPSELTEGRTMVRRYAGQFPIVPRARSGRPRLPAAFWMVYQQGNSLQLAEGCRKLRLSRAREPAVRGGSGTHTALKRKSYSPLPTSSRSHRGHQDAGIACTKSPTANPAKAFPNVMRPSIAPLPLVFVWIFPSVLPASSANGRRQRPGDFSQILNRSARTLMPSTSGLAINLVRMCNVSNGS
jgi:hypothetical protein